MSYLRHDVDCWRLAIDPHRYPPFMPVMVNPRAAQHQTQHSEAEQGCRSIAVMVVTMTRMMAMAFAGKRRVRQANNERCRERIHTPGLDERLQSWPSALPVLHHVSISLRERLVKRPNLP